MARLWSSGLELNSTTANLESNTFGTGTIVSSILRSGSYALKKSSGSNTGYTTYGFKSSNTQGGFYFREYIKIETAPNVDTLSFLAVWNGQGGEKVAIRIKSDLTPQLWNIEDNTQIGSDGTALSLNTWYCLELKVDCTTLATTAIEARINGAAFASGTIDIASGILSVDYGHRTTNTTTVYYLDDLACNDSTGSFQTSYPGEGKIIHLKPNAAGDNSDWTNDYQNVDEVTPDDGTTLVSSNTLDQIDDHNLFNPDSLGTNDTINVVQVGVRFNGAGASSNASFVLRIKASASGTVEESGAITPSNTTWVTNAAASPRNYSLTLYDLPGASTTAWTKADLETAQIGYRLSATSTNAAQISTVWLLVDYTPDTNRIQVTNVSRTQADNTSPVSFTHVVPTTDTNRILVVTSQAEDNASGGDRPITGITYNSVALTKVRNDDTTVGSNDTSEIWYLLNPDTGSNTVAVTYTAACEGVVIQAISIANAAQSGQPDANNGANGNSTTASVSVTTVADNCIVVDSTTESGSTNVLTMDGSQEQLSQEGNSGQLTGSSAFKFKGTAGAVTMSATKASALWAMSAASFKQVAAAGGGDATTGIFQTTSRFWGS